MSEALDGRVALVTGGARGIGLAISKRLHALGASVVVADSGVSISGSDANPAVAESVASELGARSAAFTSDLSEPEAAALAVELAVSRFGGIDLVVNNAAILRDSFVFKANPANWDAVLKTNLGAAFYVLAAATPHLRDQVKAGRAPGRIVNVTSSAGLYGNLGQSAYASSKAGLFGLTRVVAMDLARAGICCNAIAPFARTRVTDSIAPANAAQQEYKQRAQKISPASVAELVAFLCSPAAANISGQLLGVRGREVFLFSQPRPIERLVAPEGAWDGTDFSALFQRSFQPKFTELTTDLEAFNTDPLI
jgi:NAD(P)-dependent dehydrogenase (short-subunit alcohol dehydrogenase family)